jgi:hypothetical protein
MEGIVDIKYVRLTVRQRVVGTYWKEGFILIFLTIKCGAVYLYVTVTHSVCFLTRGPEIEFIFIHSERLHIYTKIELCSCYSIFRQITS